MRKIVSLTVAIAVVMIAGCNKDEPTVARQDGVVESQIAAQTNAAPPAEETFAPVAGVSFEVTPSKFRKCEATNGRTIANIKWDVSQADVQYVNVLVANGGDPKLFVTGKSSGERQSGNWVVDGTTFTLQNASNKKTLAIVRVKGVDC